MKFSFIISSVDKYDDLKRCIESIGKAYDYYNNNIDVEILVVFKGAKTEDKRVDTKYDNLVRFYTFDNIGLSEGRNIGIEKSSGDYLIFIDDDATVKDDFLKVLLNYIAKYSDINAFCGRIMDPAKKVPFFVLFENNSPKNLRRIDYQYFLGSAHILSRKAVDKIGFYDKRFGSGAKYFGAEESDMFFRLKAANEEVLYMPDLIFYHPIPAMSSRYMYNYSFANGAMLIKNCVHDKIHSFIYCFIFLRAISKASVRVLQKLILGGIYKEKDERCHYSSVVKGMFKGMRTFFSEDLAV